jgi:putative ABC transport system ATP-binding protein
MSHEEVEDYTVTLLSLDRVSKTFQSGNRSITVLSDVSLALAPGERLAVIGPSGSGKSTLLALAAGLDTPTSGSVSLGGTSLAELSEDGRAVLRNSLVGFVFQNFQLIPSLTAAENVALPAELLAQLPPDSIQARARELLVQVGLEDRTTHYPSQLSGGEQQRVAIARALINRPQIIFADEPTGNLDSVSAAHVLDLLIELNEQHETGLLCVTHDPRVAARMHRSIEVQDGRVQDSRGEEHKHRDRRHLDTPVQI